MYLRAITLQIKVWSTICLMFIYNFRIHRKYLFPKCKIFIIVRYVYYKSQTNTDQSHIFIAPATSRNLLLIQTYPDEKKICFTRQEMHTTQNTLLLLIVLRI